MGFINLLEEREKAEVSNVIKCEIKGVIDIHLSYQSHHCIKKKKLV